MKYLTILTLCVFLISISVLTFADDPAQIKQPEQKIETDASGEGKLIKVAKELPSTLITKEEENSRVMKEIEELQEEYDYADDPE